MPAILRPETPADQSAIWAVHRSAFDSAAEADLVNALRDGGYARVSVVAEVAGMVVGHILFSELRIATASGRIDALSLAPLAVLPDHQRQGIGTLLVNAGLRMCHKQGHTIVAVLGQPDYYTRFGFSAQLAKPLVSPFGHSEAWMATELVPGALNGVAGEVQFPPPFLAFE
ncbi:MAG: GNAT family N-acetyltransferase [Pirellulales bacterium]